MSSTLHIHTGGPVTIFDSTSGDGSWFQVHPNIRNLTFQHTLTGSSAGAVVSNDVNIQVSNDGTNPIATVALALEISSTGSFTSPYAEGGSIDAHYKYVRAVTATGTTQSSGTAISVVATPHLIG